MPIPVTTTCVSQTSVVNFYDGRKPEADKSTEAATQAVLTDRSVAPQEAGVARSPSVLAEVSFHCHEPLAAREIASAGPAWLFDAHTPSLILFVFTLLSLLGAGDAAAQPGGYEGQAIDKLGEQQAMLEELLTVLCSAGADQIQIAAQHGPTAIPFINAALGGRLHSGGNATLVYPYTFTADARALKEIQQPQRARADKLFNDFKQGRMKPARRERFRGLLTNPRVQVSFNNMVPPTQYGAQQLIHTQEFTVVAGHMMYLVQKFARLNKCMEPWSGRRAKLAPLFRVDTNLRAAQKDMFDIFERRIAKHPNTVLVADTEMMDGYEDYFIWYFQDMGLAAVTVPTGGKPVIAVVAPSMLPVLHRFAAEHAGVTVHDPALATPSLVFRIGSAKASYDKWVSSLGPAWVDEKLSAVLGESVGEFVGDSVFHVAISSVFAGVPTALVLALFVIMIEQRREAERRTVQRWIGRAVRRIGNNVAGRVQKFTAAQRRRAAAARQGGGMDPLAHVATGRRRRVVVTPGTGADSGSTASLGDFCVLVKHDAELAKGEKEWDAYLVAARQELERLLGESDNPNTTAMAAGMLCTILSLAAADGPRQMAECRIALGWSPEDALTAVQSAMELDTPNPFVARNLLAAQRMLAELKTTLAGDSADVDEKTAGSTETKLPGNAAPTGASLAAQVAVASTPMQAAGVDFHTPARQAASVLDAQGAPVGLIDNGEVFFPPNRAAKPHLHIGADFYVLKKRRNNHIRIIDGGLFYPARLLTALAELENPSTPKPAYAHHLIGQLRELGGRFGMPLPAPLA